MGQGGAIPSIVIERRGKLRFAPTSNLMPILNPNQAAMETPQDNKHPRLPTFHVSCSGIV